MTGHTYRQKGRNVARLIREGGPAACPRGTTRAPPRGLRGGEGIVVRSHPRAPAHTHRFRFSCSSLPPLSPPLPLPNVCFTLRKIEPACGVSWSVFAVFNQPGEILCQCFIVRSSRLRRRPTACEGEGIVASSVAECVYTLAHVVGFVTRSLRSSHSSSARRDSDRIATVFQLKLHNAEPTASSY